MKQPDPIVASKLILTNPRFQRAVVGWVRRFIEDLPRGNPARQIEAEHFERQSAALDALASYIGEQEVDDPRLFQLAEAARAQPGNEGWIHTQGFTPSRSQSRLFHMLGLGAPVAPEAAFSRLISAGLADALRGHTATHQELRHERDEADTARAAAEAKVAPLAEVEAARARLTSQLDAAQEEIAKLSKRVADLEKFVIAAGEAESADQRRTKVEDEVGIYFRDVDGQRIYEICWQENGRTRWRTVGPDLDEARKLRAELAGKPGEDDHAPGPTDGEDSGEGDDNADQEPGDTAGEEG